MTPATSAAGTAGSPDTALLDACSFEAIKAATGGSQDLRDVLLAIVTSDAFLHTNPGAE